MFAAPAPPHDGLSSYDYIAVAMYLLGTIGIALYFAKRQGSTEEFFLGGRNMPWFAVGLSIMATLMSTISYLAQPGELIKNGITMLVGTLAVPLNILVIFMLFVPFFMRLRLTSAYEFLELRFNYTARAMGAALFVFMRLGWMGVVVYTSSMALTAMTRGNIPQEYQSALIYFVIVGVGVFATVYTAVGGMRAVIWTDVVQFLVLFGGTLITLGYIATTTGTGPAHWWETASTVTESHASPPIFSWDIRVQRTMVWAICMVFFWTICTHVSDQVVLQRYFSTKSLKAARNSYLLAAGADFVVLVLLALCGLALMSFYLEHPTFLPLDADTGEHVSVSSNFADKVFPYFIGHQLPPGVGGLILAALIAAAMSSIDSGVNSVSAVITTDFFARLNPQGAEKMSELKLAKILTITIGMISTGVACCVAYIVISHKINIFEVMQPAFNMFLGPLASLFVIGMFLPRCTARTTIPAVMLGTVVAIIWSYWKPIAGLDYWKLINEEWDASVVIDNAPTFTLSTTVPFLVAVISAGILSLIFESSTPHSGSGYTWYQIMKRDPDAPNVSTTEK
ncbi:Sodium/glucose cotransporter [Symmachiella dynata]|uniref:Sodium/glucose cotransporter n=1 Tax=Symmachiella dynata TaxID=2527995 RepID=A0A517ZTV7_9PLAN|nr:sodium/solute symporter [Symmachiella dynata]QDU45909.1 Sodium/glucose cotransporter [Symmachiella dynata]